MSSKTAGALGMLCLAAMLNGCVNFAPPHTRPPLPVPVTDDRQGQMTAGLSWRLVYAEPRLAELIDLALDNNRDLRVATLNMERARAQYQIQQASSEPGVNLDLNASRGKDGGNQFSANLGLASYELDVFSRVRNLNETALQDFLMRDESRLSVRISLIAETASAWLALAAGLQRQALAARTLENRQHSLALATTRAQLGATGELPLAQAQSALLAARAELLAQDAQLAQARHALEFIVGRTVPEALLPLADGEADLEVLPGLPAGMGSQALLGRPDVQAAEHGLRGADANIGVVRAARFPRIALTGSTGTAGDQLSRLFQRGVWTFGTGLALSVFDGGAHRASTRAAEVGRDIAVAEYDKAIQVAFREVADALAVSATLAQRLDTQQQLLAAARRQLALAQVQFRAGASGQLALLDAQRIEYGAELDMITLRLTIQNNRITLYKVLGGGWNNAALPER